MCNRNRTKTIRHHCDVSRPAFAKKYPNIALLDIQSTDESQANCDECENGLVCEQHKKGDHPNPIPLMATLFFEENARGRFSRMRWYTPDLNRPDSGCCKNAFCYTEYPDELVDVEMSLEAKTVRYNKKASTAVTNEFLAKNDCRVLNAVEKFIYHILDHPGTFNNFCILTFGQGPLTSVYNALLKKGLQPRNMKSYDNKLLTFTMPGCDVRLLDASFQLGTCDLDELAERYGMDPPKTVFPTKMRRMKFALKNDPMECPALTMFESILDTDCARQKQKWFHDNFDGQWLLLDQLEDFSDEICSLQIGAVCHYISFAMDLQVDLVKLEQPPVLPGPGQLMFTHPFQNGISTLPTFLFHIYKLLQMPENTLKAVNKEFSGYQQSKSSEQEMKWIEFIARTHEHKLAFRGAYESGSGQYSCLVGIRPDGYCTECK